MNKTSKKKVIVATACTSLLLALSGVVTFSNLAAKNVNAETEIVYGDVNGDKVLDLKDAIRLSKYLQDATVEVDATLCDANGDGVVNGSDVKRVLEMINGYDRALYKTINQPATCEQEGLQARYSSKEGDENAYETVLPKIEHTYDGVACGSCGKSYYAIDVSGNHKYATSPKGLYIQVNNTLEGLSGNQSVSVIYNGATQNVMAAKMEGGIYFYSGTASEGTTLEIPAGTQFGSGDTVYVMSHDVLYAYNSGWKYQVQHDDVNKDGVCDGIDCEIEFVDITISGQKEAWATEKSGWYTYITESVFEGTLTSDDKILFNGEESTLSFTLQAANYVFIAHGKTLQAGDVAIIPQGYKITGSTGKIYVLSHAVQFTWDGSKAMFNTMHLDDDFDGKCDGCAMNMAGIAITDNNRYGHAANAMYFNVNSTAFASFGNWAAFTTVTPVLVDGVPKMLTIAKGDQANHLYLSGFGTAVAGTKIEIPEGFTFIAGETAYYLREGYTFTYDGANWTYVNSFANSFNTDALLMINEDADILTRFYDSIDGDVSDLETKSLAYFNDNWKDKGLSDLLFNFDGRVPSEYNYIGNRYSLTEFRGETDTSKWVNKNVTSTYNIWNNGGGVDPIALWIAKSKENGINPWLSFRMNDVHYQGNVISASDFQYEAMQKGWLLKDAGRNDYYKWCLDYTHEEVRQHFLNYIAEMLNRYDAYGIELDWQREIYCFPTDVATNAQYMNAFMEDLHVIVESAETKWGHDIKVMARVMRDIEQNKNYFGFDLLYWARQEEWIDVIVPSSHYGSTDSDMPIAEWIATFDEYSVEIVPGLEWQVDEAAHFFTKETVSAMANAYLGAGAKKIYAFNFFANMAQGGYKLWPYMNSEYGIMSCEKRYVVTCQNVYSWGHGCWDPLPMSLNGSAKSLAMQVGTLNNGADKIIIVGVSGEYTAEQIEKMLMVTANGKACTFIGETNSAYIASYSPAYKLYAFRVGGSVDAVDNKINFAFSSSEELTLTYVELFNGYFA